jgi:BlaI family penicillinase repressor
MSRADEPAALSEGQIEIMNLVWAGAARGGMTVGEVWEALSRQRPVARNTVQTMLTRLEEKGWLTHQLDGAAFRYLPVYPRETALRRLVRRLVDTAFAGSAEGLVMALLQGGVSRDEAVRIRKMIDDAERAAPPKAPPPTTKRPRAKRNERSGS